MRVILICCFLSIVFNYAHAQAGASLELNNPGESNGYGLVRYSNPTGKSDKVDDIDANDISGNPYFDSHWGMAIIVLINDKAIKVNKAKLNLHNNELHYIDSFAREMVVDENNVKKVFLMDAKDSNSINASFMVVRGYSGQKGGTYMQVLNAGKTALLKLNQVELKKRNYDVLSGKTMYAFQPNISYVFYKDGSITPCKLNKADIFNVLLPDAAANSWLSLHNNKLKNEKDVVSFMEYYNGEGK